MNKYCTTHNHHACIQHVPIFDYLEDEAMHVISSHMYERHLAKGEFLFRAGERTDALYIISSGLVRIYRVLPSGKEQLIRILKPGDFVGEWTIFNPYSLHEDFAEIMKDTHVCVLEQDALQKILMDYPAISLKILSEMSQRLENSQKQTTQNSMEQVGVRLALFIADHVPSTTNLDTEAKGKDIQVDLPLARKDIASFLGSTPETISRKFKELEEAGLITQQSSRTIIVHDLENLLYYSE